MHLRVDRTLCAGHARCNAVAADLFALDDEGYAVPLDLDVPDATAASARAGAAACPEGAIELTETP